MPKLNQNRVERVPTCLNLPRTTRDALEAAIGTPGITSLTDAIVEATKTLTAKIKKEQKKNACKQK